MLLSDDRAPSDLGLSVRLRADHGEVDQGGGVVWRALDPSNYYICRYNPLEDNFRVYKVEQGKRTELASADVARRAGWRQVRVSMNADMIKCFLDGQKLLEVHDRTFPGPGKIGLWSKADAQTTFDDFELKSGGLD